MGLFDNFKNNISNHSNANGENINTSLLNNSNDYYNRTSSPVPIQNTPVINKTPVEKPQMSISDKVSADVEEFNKKVQKLQILKKQGILNDNEYEEARQKLMKQVTGLL